MCLTICTGSRNKSQRDQYAIEQVTALSINGTTQKVRVCSVRAGAPLVLIVQAGPGFPLLNEVEKIQQCMQLEQDFTVAYWDQRGCGQASLTEAQSVSLKTQIEDLRFVIRWFAEESGQQIVVLGISLGATMALQASVHEAGNIKAIVAVSIDVDTVTSDATALSFLQEKCRQENNKKIGRMFKKLDTPPYVSPAAFQLRARLLSDSGGIEYGKRFWKLLRGLLYSLISTYGWFGALQALRNMNAIQRKVLPELATLDLFSNWPRSSVPVHYVFGECDPLVSCSMIQNVLGMIKADDTVVSLPESGHMTHFDAPATVKSIITKAHYASAGY